MTTTFEIDQNYAPVHSAENALSQIYTRASEALDLHQLDLVYCNIFIEIAPDKTAFAEVQIDATTSDVIYYVTRSDNDAPNIPALNYTQAVRELRQLMR